MKNYLPDKAKSKIAVAMSGGVDSSVAAYLLKEAGYEIVGVTAWLLAGAGRCCDHGVADAVKVCDQLGIEHHAVDLRKAFAEGIIRDFHESYSRGETPIPCISCNNDIKWGHLLEYATDTLGATHLASGHYSKIVSATDHAGKQVFKMYKALEKNKDQSYMLWGLTQDQLSKTVFPLADMDKAEVRQIAQQAGLCVAQKPDSQDICFVSGGMTNSDYLLRILGEKPGKIIEIESGQILGEHKGSFNYTYGQRKGLGIAYKEPLYVVKTDPKLNAVYVGTKDKLLAQKARGDKLNLISCPDMQSDAAGRYFPARVKIRYHSKSSPARVYLQEAQGAGLCTVQFEEVVEAVTPGQAMVFYSAGDEQELYGGAWISE